MITDFSLTMNDGTVVDFRCEDPDCGFTTLYEMDDLPLTWERSKEMDKNLRLYGTLDRHEIPSKYFPTSVMGEFRRNPSPYQGLHHIVVLGQ